MSHHHNHSHENIRRAFFMNLIFTIIELIGGVLTNSSAIVSDAIHDLGDTLTLGISYLLDKISERDPNKDYTFGYRYMSVVISLFNSTILILSSFFVLIIAFNRFNNLEEVNSRLMIFFAFLGIVFNGYIVIRFKGSKKISDRAVLIHILEDLLGWISVLIGSVLIFIFDWQIVDPLLSMILGIVILITASRNIWQTFQIILHRVPKGIEVEKISTEIMVIDNVLEIKDLHIWTVDNERLYAIVHIVYENNEEFIKENIRTILRKQGIEHTTIELETQMDSDKNRLTH